MTMLQLPAALPRIASTMLATLLLAATVLAAPARAAEPLDRILVVVNDGVILQSEVDQALEEARRQFIARGIAPPDLAAVRAQVLERLILTRIQTQRAQQGGIRVDDRELNEVLTGLARQNGLTLAEFADAVRQDGLDYLAVREQIREEVLIQRIRSREVDSRVTVTDQDVDMLLSMQGTEPDTEFRLSHILVSVPEGASADARDAARTRAQGHIPKASRRCRVAISTGAAPRTCRRCSRRPRRSSLWARSAT
jgi:peptidyl-prolyl cis-trans isomerase SurA